MGSMLGRLSKLANSSQGRKLTAKARDYANSPEGKRKIEDVRRRVGQTKGGGSR